MRHGNFGFRSGCFPVAGVCGWVLGCSLLLFFFVLFLAFFLPPGCCDEVDWTTFTSETWVCVGGFEEGVVELGAAVEVGR